MTHNGRLYRVVTGLETVGVDYMNAPVIGTAPTLVNAGLHRVVGGPDHKQGQVETHIPILAAMERDPRAGNG